MKFCQVIIAMLFVICFSTELSAQTVRPTVDSNDQIKVHSTKYDLLKKVKENIERKQNDSDEEPGDPNIDTGKLEPVPSIKRTMTRKLKLSKKKD